MALNTIFACSIFPNPDGMHSAILRETVADFRVAIQALEFHTAGAYVVTFGTTQDSGK
jgi:hypothetical protein